VNTQLSNELQALDSATGGIFSAPTSGERANRVRIWLATQPDLEWMQTVYRELSARDKGAAKALRERLDEVKRERHQTQLVQEWAQKGEAIRASVKISLAQALAWQRDAAKAGAPLSREPLASIKGALNDRVRNIEDLQHRAQVLRESAVLLGQRTEVLASKPWQEALTQREVLGQDVQRWLAECKRLTQDGDWSCVDPKFPPALQANAQQVQAVWEAFHAALELTQAAAADPQQALPSVPAWAQDIKRQRGQAQTVTETAAVQAKPRVDPALRAQAVEALKPLLEKLEVELAEGHGKASTEAANALRQSLREHEAVLPERLLHQAQSALAAASELEGWQRWRADQLRAELLAKAEALFKPAAQVADGETAPEPQPAMGGRKMQETLRELREQWKQTDQGGMPNHALWKRFDQACNRAYQVVEAWHEKVKTESELHKAQRLELIAQLQAWAAEHAQGPDWRAVARELARFAERWRQAGHVSEKIFAELQPQWKAAYQAAHAPLDAAHRHAVAQRQSLIDEAVALSQKAGLPLDQIKALQQRWQEQSHAHVLDRRTEQKMWEAFRSPIDAMFQRKSQEREQSQAALNAHDKAVLVASKALEAACKSGDAVAIRAATQALQNISRGLPDPTQALAPVTHPEPEAVAVATPAADAPAADPTPEAKPVAVALARKVVAVRGDDRPGMKKTEVAPAGKGPRKGPMGRPERGDRLDRADRPARADRDALPRGPRLGDDAFRAMKHAQDMAELALKKLAAQAHGEIVSQIVSAWKDRSAEQLPAAREMGARVNATQRQAWQAALGHTGSGNADASLLRLEIAAEAPTPAPHLDARRAMQLNLLTQRHQATPRETWASDVEKVLSSPYAEDTGKRLQTVLKVFLR
jgi:ATP-dependent RNA helicase SUPV3L1/SUV3